MPRERRTQDRRSGKKDRRNKERRGCGSNPNFSSNQQAKDEGQLPRFKRAASLEPMNQGQAEYIHALFSHPYVFATGFAGTSKTYIPTRIAAQLLQEESIKKIVIARPAASMSNSLGYFKGDAIEKMRGWIAPVLDALLEEFPPSTIDYFLEHGKIEAVPMETVKGRSMEDCFILIDEAEDLMLKEVKTLLTRLGTNATMVFAGDISQVDIHKSGLGEFLVLRSKNARLKRVTSHIDFDSYDDIVRSDAVKEVIVGLDEIGLGSTIAA